MPRIALVVEYNGAHYHGWQSQQHQPKTLQATLECALTSVANEPVSLTCAGRTDAGVHATHQVVHFDTKANRPDKAWVFGANRQLPDDISIRSAQPVAENFHARYSATARSYRYIIFNHPVRPALLDNQVSWYHGELNAKLMHQSVQCLLGEHDFNAFRAAGCQSRTSYRCIEHISWHRKGDYVVLDIKANAFLHHMVRNIVGVSLVVGRQEQPVAWVQEVLKSADRTQAGVTAKPNGLYLVDVAYSAEYALPQASMGFLGFL